MFPILLQISVASAGPNSGPAIAAEDASFQRPSERTPSWVTGYALVRSQDERSPSTFGFIQQIELRNQWGMDHSKRVDSVSLGPFHAAKELD